MEYPLNTYAKIHSNTNIDDMSLWLYFLDFKIILLINTLSIFFSLLISYVYS